MKSTAYRSQLARAPLALLAALLALLAGPGGAQRAAAKTYQLKTGTRALTMPDGTVVQMWGFGLASDEQVSIPGPALDVPAGDSTLTIELTNNLPVPVSIVIPGQPAAMTPQWQDGSSGARTSPGQRVLSLTHVAAAGGGSATYEWTGLRPGTYLYHSGTHPAVQVAMGLHGALKHDAAAGQAYPGLAYDSELALLFSEIDPALCAAVTSGAFGTPSYPSTVNYRPKYYLLNGQPLSAVPPPPPAQVGQRVLLRLINAGLKSLVPTALGGYFKLVAEDGFPAPFGMQRYSALLAAGKTRDALYEPTAEGSLLLFDRALRASGAPGSAGGVLARLGVTTAAGAPTAMPDSYTVAEDSVLDTLAQGLAGVLANDTGGGPLTAVLVSGPHSGMLSLQADGSFSYTPHANFSGTDSFSYQALDGTTPSAAVTVAITVTPINDAPTVAPDSYHTMAGESLIVAAPGVLANDSDPDGDALTAELSLALAPTGGTLNLLPDGSFEYVPSPGTTSDSFGYVAFDGTMYSELALVSIEVMLPINEAPVAADDYASTPRNTPVVINVVANDTDPDGTIVPSSVQIVDQPTRGGLLTNPLDGTLVYRPRRTFKGTDTFTYTVADNLGLASAKATVRVNVTR